MEIVKIVGVGLIATVLVILLKQYRPEFALYLSLAAGVLLFSMVIGKMASIVELLQNLANKSNFHSQFLLILLKITGIAILTEFAVSIAKDAGESAIASKIDLAGKVLVISLSVPILKNILETINTLLP